MAVQVQIELSIPCSYKQCNTPTLLSEVDSTKLIALGINDQEERKQFMTAIQKAGYMKPAKPPRSAGSNISSTSSQKKVALFPFLSTAKQLTIHRLLASNASGKLPLTRTNSYLTHHGTIHLPMAV
jgi:hypothetical protein